MQKISDASKWSVTSCVKQKVTLYVCWFGQEVMALFSASGAFKPCRELS